MMAEKERKGEEEGETNREMLRQIRDHDLQVTMCFLFP